MPINCLTCDTEIGSLDKEGYMSADTKNGATFFTSGGNYGSPFDPFNNSPYTKHSLHIALCDDCLKQYALQQKIVETKVHVKHVRTATGKHYELES